MGRAVLVGCLLALLGAAVWFAVYAWTSIEGPPLPASFQIALWLGVIFSLIIGCGLMALVFYSSRRGYDDQVRPHDRQ